MTLAAVCDQYAAGRPIDFLKVDAESHEREVLVGGRLGPYRPRAVVVESAELEPPAWEPILVDAGYLFAAYDGLNRYYLRHEDRDLLPRLARPANCLDDYVLYESRSRSPTCGPPSSTSPGQRDEALARLAAAEARLAALADLGPSSIALARRFRRAAGRFPRVASTVRRVLKRAG